MENQELNSLIGRLLWGFVVIIDTRSGLNYMMGHDHKPIELPNYSEDQEAANMVEQFLENQGYIMSVQNTVDSSQSKWFACFFKANDGKKYKPSMADTVPKAICLAAIAAVQGTNFQ